MFPKDGLNREFDPSVDQVLIKEGSDELGRTVLGEGELKIMESDKVDSGEFISENLSNHRRLVRLLWLKFKENRV